MVVIWVTMVKIFLSGECKECIRKNLLAVDHFTKLTEELEQFCKFIGLPSAKSGKKLLLIY